MARPGPIEPPITVEDLVQAFRDFQTAGGSPEFIAGYGMPAEEMHKFINIDRWDRLNPIEGILLGLSLGVVAAEKRRMALKATKPQIHTPHRSVRDEAS